MVFKVEPYVTSFLPRYHWSEHAKLRYGISPINVETGRYCRIHCPRMSPDWQLLFMWFWIIELITVTRLTSRGGQIADCYPSPLVQGRQGPNWPIYPVFVVSHSRRVFGIQSKIVGTLGVRAKKVYCLSIRKRPYLPGAVLGDGAECVLPFLSL